MIAGDSLCCCFPCHFKVSAAPFHFWTPDVYDGAPTVFTSFMATIVMSPGIHRFHSVFLMSGFGSLQSQWLIVDRP